MILKNPYIYLIKHFKLIHLVLTALFIYLTVKVSNVLGYYNSFIVGNASRLDAYKYIDNWCVIVAIISIIICAFLYALLRYKKKPRALYIGLIAFLIVIIFLDKTALEGLNVIYVSILDTKTMRLYRDLLQILVIFQYLSIGLVLVRALGFDIKKFNFVDDLVELNIDVTDEEEVELTLGNTNTLVRKFNRQIREFRYYYLENKLFINIILIILGSGLLVGFIVNREVINKVYKQGEVFSTETFSFNVISSFVTEKDDDNKVIIDDDNTFVIAKMIVTPLKGNRELNTASLILKTNGNSYSSNSYYGDRFSDLGIPYRKGTINRASTYLFLFKVPKSDVSKKMRLVYGNRVVSLSPMMLDEDSKSKKMKLGDTINLSETMIGSGSFKINSADLQLQFPYEYKYEINGQQYTNSYTISSSNGAILKLDIDSTLDSYKFINKYVTLKYKWYAGEKEVLILENKTPGSCKDSLYIRTDNDILEATSIWFEINVRNKQYIYTLK